MVTKVKRGIQVSAEGAKKAVAKRQAPITAVPVMTDAERAIAMLESAKEEIDGAIARLRDPMLPLGLTGSHLRDAQSAISIVLAADFPRMIAAKRAAREALKEFDALSKDEQFDLSIEPDKVQP